MLRDPSVRMLLVRAGPPYTADASEWPLVHLVMLRKMETEEFEAYLDECGGFLDRQERYGFILEVESGVGMLPFSQVRMQLNFLRDRADSMGRWMAGMAFVLKAPVHRGALKAMLSMQRMATDFEVFAEVEQARRWLLGDAGAVRPNS